jgi:hypothetical protein
MNRPLFSGYRFQSFSMKNKYKFNESTIIVLKTDSYHCKFFCLSKNMWAIFHYFCSSFRLSTMKMNSKEFKIMSVVVFCKEICICYVQITKHAQKSYDEKFSSGLRMPWSYSKRSSLCGSTCFNLCKTISHF